MHAILLFLALQSPYDALIESEWKKAHVHPAPPVDDAGFLRRVYLDLGGELPPPEVVRAFLDDPSTDKRTRLIDGLIASQRYAAHFTDVWARLLLGRNPPGGAVDELAFRQWLEKQLADNVRWDVLAKQLIAASGRNSEGGPRNPAQREKMQKLDEALGTPSPEPTTPINGAVNYLLRFAQQPEDAAGHYARVFLGVQIQCAQCHDHPSEKWKQDDFRHVAAIFARMRPRPVEIGKQMGIRRVILEDGPPLRMGAQLKPKQMVKRELGQLDGRALDGTVMLDRAALAEWTATAQNPWFARAIVNRYWAYLVGRGFVDPVDDFRSKNPPSAPALLDRLASDFVAHHFDLKWLVRAICLSRVYQLSAAGRDGRLWADYRLRPLEPEELLAALTSATGMKEIAAAQPTRRLFDFLFSVDEESDTDGFSGTLPQALFALNGLFINFGAGAHPGSPLAEVLALPLSDEQKISALYLRALSRPPTAAETRRWIQFLAQPREAARHDEPIHESAPQKPKQRIDPSGGPPRAFAQRAARFHASAHEQAWEDLYWALLNSSEFGFHH